MLALNHLLEQPKLDLGPDMVEAGLPKAVATRKSQVCRLLLTAATSQQK